MQPNHYVEGGLLCPKCKCISIPLLKKDEGADAAACQNLDCRVVVNRDNIKIGRWSKGYKKIVMDRRRNQINK